MHQYPSAPFLCPPSPSSSSPPPTPPSRSSPPEARKGEEHLWPGGAGAQGSRPRGQGVLLRPDAGAQGRHAAAGRSSFY